MGQWNLKFHFWNSKKCKITLDNQVVRLYNSKAG
jgi:hypothetical protein